MPREPTKITGDMTELAKEHGTLIFRYLMKEFPNRQLYDTDMIMNSLIFAIICLRDKFVHEKDYPLFADLIKKILEKNL